GPPLLREERLRVSLRAQCPLLPLRRVAQQVQSGPDYAAIHTCVPPSDAPADSPAQPPHAEGVTFVPSRAVRTPPANDPTEITRVSCVRRQAEPDKSAHPDEETRPTPRVTPAPALSVQSRSG